MMNNEVQILADHAATEKLARKLAQSYGYSNYLILLSGPVGAGKTTLARAFIEELIPTNNINSPSYSYIKTYHGLVNLSHCDLYRIEHVNEIEELGLLDYLNDQQSLRLVEWPERAPILFDLAQLLIEIAMVSDHRLVKITNLTSS